MSRIPSHTIENAPAAARPLLTEMLQFSPTGRPLAMHAQMAHAPAVLEAYVSIRRATGRHGTLDQPVRTALMLAAAAADANEYALAIISMLALWSGWRPGQVADLAAGRDVGDGATDALLAVVREAAANHGHVSDAVWDHALGSGWDDGQLAEAFAYLGLRVLTQDVAALAAFYSTLVGVPVTLNSYYVEVPAGAVSVGFSRRRFTEYREDRAARPACPYRREEFMLDFEVSEIGAEHERIAAIGLDWVLPPTVQPWGNSSMIFRDPMGNLVNVFSRGRDTAGPGGASTLAG